MPLKIPYRGSDKRIEEISLVARSNFNMNGLHGSRVGFHLRKRLKQMGCQICCRNRHSEFMVLRSNHDFSVSLPDFRSGLSDNFFLAKALGYYILNCDFKEKDSPITFSIHDESVYEYGAYQFATAFLIPEKEFRLACENYDGYIYSVAGHFDVPLTPLKNRAKCLNIQLSKG